MIVLNISFNSYHIRTSLFVVSLSRSYPSGMSETVCITEESPHPLHLSDHPGSKIRVLLYEACKIEK